jgi:thioredoxin reductase (NADPH)
MVTMADSVDVDVAVAGAGAAGLSAAMALTDYGLRVAVVDRLGGGGELLNFTLFRDDGGLGISATGPEIGGELLAKAMDAGVELVFSEVTGLSVVGGRHALAHDSGAVEASATVIATGRRRRAPALDGAEELVGRGICFCGACDGPLYSGKHVAVVGVDDVAGYEALEVAQYVSDVALVLPSSTAVTSHRMRELIATQPNIELVPGVPSEVLADGGVVSGLVVSSEGAERRLDVAGIFSCYVEADSDWCVELVQRGAGGRILVDAALRTATPGVYAVGEVREGSGDSVLSAIADGRCVARTVLQDLGGLGR